MRSSEMPVHGEYETASAPDPLIPGTDSALEWRYADLTQQHHDLDYLICALSEQAACDELLVARLKKRKLQLKDKIARVASDLRGTGDATARP